MQWILDSQSALLSGFMGSLIGAGVIGWWVKQRMLLSNQLLKQQRKCTLNHLESIDHKGSKTQVN